MLYVLVLRKAREREVLILVAYGVVVLEALRASCSTSFGNLTCRGCNVPGNIFCIHLPGMVHTRKPDHGRSTAVRIGAFCFA